MNLAKTDLATTFWAPFEKGRIRITHSRARALQIRDASGRPYLQRPVRAGQTVTFCARGASGQHRVEVLDPDRRPLETLTFVLRARTHIACNRGPFARLAGRVAQLLECSVEYPRKVINGRLYNMLVCWGRDHVHTLKAQKYFIDDVQSGLDYWLETQEPKGMLWDCIYPNDAFPGRSWLGEALGKGYFRYDDGGRVIVRRIPVEADCEFLYTEGVWAAWKAGGDDAWMARQLPTLDRALTYNNSHPTRWSRKHGLVKRSMCMDSWDFANPHFCNGDKRCINPGDAQFLFHGDNSGLYSSYWRLADMHAYLGHARRAADLRRQGEALRRRANAKLFFGNHYGHMIPEDGRRAKAIYALVGDERERMSFSTGYTINRGMATHDMAVKVLDEYQRRGRRLRRSSFAEWWSMDPMYTEAQWPRQGNADLLAGGFMNGAISPIVAGELAKAAFDHGREAYGVDILERVWALSERDGGNLHDSYLRLPGNPPPPRARFRAIDIRGVVNRGLRHGAYRGVLAWTNEGDNDLRDLPVGRQHFGAITFDVIDPALNAGRAVLRLDSDPTRGLPSVKVPVPNMRARSLHFLHTQAHSVPTHAVIGRYTVQYADGTTATIWIRNGHEIGHWWGCTDLAGAVDRATTRVAWRGANPTWSNVGIHMFGWNNPHPEKPIVAMVLEACTPTAGHGGILLAAISAGDAPVAFETNIRSYGIPPCWAQAAVYYALAEGLAGIEDQGRVFSHVQISPRWAATTANEADVTLHYPASDGYCAYRYRLDTRRRELTLDLTGAFKTANVRCLLPAGVRTVTSVRLGARELPYAIETIEQSRYVTFRLESLPAMPVRIRYRHV